MDADFIEVGGEKYATTLFKMRGKLRRLTLFRLREVPQLGQLAYPLPQAKARQVC